MKIGRNSKCLCGSGQKYKNCCLNKPTTSSANKTAMVVGAGAVENAWAPVLRALQPYHDFPLTGDGANSFLARLIYLLRWWASNETELACKELQKHKEFLAEIRERICEELKLAQDIKEIRIRKEFTNIVDSLLLKHSKRFMLVTTNWDCVVEHALSAYLNNNGRCKVIPLHIHGSIEDANTIYLPTEMTKEPYRSKDEETMIGSAHGSAWRGLEEAHRIVIYGLSLSPLDAELCQILACGFSNENLHEICIVAPDHEQVAHRVNLLLDRRRVIEVRGYEPGNLEHAHNYTIYGR